MTPLKNTMFAVSERAGRTKRRLCTISLFLILISCTDNSQQDSNPSGYIEMAQDTTYKVEIDPSTITLEYLDSITNWHEMTNVRFWLDEENNNRLFSIKDQAINDRLEFFDDTYRCMDFDTYTNFGTNEYHVIFHDPKTDFFYVGSSTITNGFKITLEKNTNHIDTNTRNVLVHVTNLSPSNRLYLNAQTRDQLFMTLTRVYDKFDTPEVLADEPLDYIAIDFVETNTEIDLYGKSNLFIFKNSQGNLYPDLKVESNSSRFLLQAFMRSPFSGRLISVGHFIESH